ncbi:MAG: NYN domain-containing protein [Eubacteriales bacterium]
MRKYLIVDAYNMINQWTSLKEVAQESLEEAREKLISQLQSYCEIKNYYFVLVFDAYNNEEGLKEIVLESGLIIYTQKNQTADSYIEKLMYDIPSIYDIYVATSDFSIQRIVVARGGLRISALEMEKEVQFTIQAFLKKNKESYQEDKNHLSKLIDKDTLNKLKRLKNE